MTVLDTIHLITAPTRLGSGSGLGHKNVKPNCRYTILLQGTRMGQYILFTLEIPTGKNTRNCAHGRGYNKVPRLWQIIAIRESRLPLHWNEKERDRRVGRDIRRAQWAQRHEKGTKLLWRRWRTLVENAAERSRRRATRGKTSRDMGTLDVPGHSPNHNMWRQNHRILAKSIPATAAVQHRWLVPGMKTLRTTSRHFRSHRRNREQIGMRLGIVPASRSNLEP